MESSSEGPKCGKVGETPRSVLVAMFGDGTHGRSTVAPPISVPDPDATPMQLEQSEETRGPKHTVLPANVSKEEFDAHQLKAPPISVVVRSLRERQSSG